MPTAIVVSNGFDGTWPFAADYARERWAKESDLIFLRLPPGHECDLVKLGLPSDVTKLLLLGCQLTVDSLDRFPELREVGMGTRVIADSPLAIAATERGS